MDGVVVMTTDLSPDADRAWPQALRWARALNTEVHLLYVVDRLLHINLGEVEDHEGWLRTVTQAFRHKLERRAEDLSTRGVPVRGVVRVGRVESEVLAYAGAHARLVVSASHGLGGVRRFFMGSVAARIAQAATPAVVIVPPTAEDKPLDRMLFTTDLGELAEAAARQLIPLALALCAHVDLFHADVDSTLITMLRGEALKAPPGGWEVRRAVAERRLGEVARVFVDAGVQVAVHHARASRAADAIVERAAQRDDSAIVMGAHSRGPLARAWLGSVTDEVLRRSSRPVLVLKP